MNENVWNVITKDFAPVPLIVLATANAVPVLLITATTMRVCLAASFPKGQKPPIVAVWKGWYGEAGKCQIMIKISNNLKTDSLRNSNMLGNINRETIFKNC